MDWRHSHHLIEIRYQQWFTQLDRYIFKRRKNNTNSLGDITFLIHLSLLICSTASQVLLLPAFYFTVAHLVMPEPTHLSATSIYHTPFIILICHFLFKGTGLSFWIPGLIYSSRNMHLACITSTSCGSLLSQAHWRISVALASKILNET